jgi:hypothetical protein
MSLLWDTVIDADVDLDQTLDSGLSNSDFGGGDDSPSE